jgi:hypothetical protein
MATERQKEAARRNLVKARRAQTARVQGRAVPRPSTGLSTSEENRLSDDQFAFPEARKEPLTDAAHVRNAVARFDQVEGVSEAQRDHAWWRIQTAARRMGVDLGADDWRELVNHGQAGHRH